MNFASFLREDQRLVMLRFLSEMPSYSSNSSVIYQALTRYGHAPSRDQIKSELRWLEEQGLVTVEDIGTVLVARLTERGADVAAGRAIVRREASRRGGLIWEESPRFTVWSLTSAPISSAVCGKTV